MVRQRQPFLCLITCVMSILSWDLINKDNFIRPYRPTADVSRHYVFKGSSTFEMHAEELDRILISVYWSSLVNVYPKHHLNHYQAQHPYCIIHCDNI